MRKVKVSEWELVKGGGGVLCSQLSLQVRLTLLKLCKLCKELVFIQDNQKHF